MSELEESLAIRENEILLNDAHESVSYMLVGLTAVTAVAGMASVVGVSVVGAPVLIPAAITALVVVSTITKITKVLHQVYYSKGKRYAFLKKLKHVLVNLNNFIPQKVVLDFERN